VPKLPPIQTALDTMNPSKRAQSEQVSKDIDQFLSNGGVIKHIPIGVGLLNQWHKKTSTSARIRIAMTNHREAQLAIKRKRKKIKPVEDRNIFSLLPKFLR